MKDLDKCFEILNRQGEDVLSRDRKENKNV